MVEDISLYGAGGNWKIFAEDEKGEGEGEWKEGEGGYDSGEGGQDD